MLPPLFVSLLSCVHVCFCKEVGVAGKGVSVTVAVLLMELIICNVFVDLTQQLMRRLMSKTNSVVCFLVASTSLSNSCGFKCRGLSNLRSWTFSFVTKKEVVQYLIRFRSGWKSGLCLHGFRHTSYFQETWMILLELKANRIKDALWHASLYNFCNSAGSSYPHNSADLTIYSIAYSNHKIIWWEEIFKII